MKLSPQYIAGFIDGEGYLGIIKKTSKVSTLGYYFTPALKITQVTRNDEVLKNIKEFFGCGNLTLNKRNALKSDNGVNKTSLEFRSEKRVTPILKIIYPYLVVKKKQAKVLLEYAKLPQVKSFKTRIKIDRKRNVLYEEIRFLNRKGLAETKRSEAERLSNSPNHMNK